MAIEPAVRCCACMNLRAGFRLMLVWLNVDAIFGIGLSIFIILSSASVSLRMSIRSVPLWRTYAFLGLYVAQLGVQVKGHRAGAGHCQSSALVYWRGLVLLFIAYTIVDLANAVSWNSGGSETWVTNGCPEGETDWRALERCVGGNETCISCLELYAKSNSQRLWPWVNLLGNSFVYGYFAFIAWSYHKRMVDGSLDTMMHPNAIGLHFENRVGVMNHPWEPGSPATYVDVSPASGSVIGVPVTADPGHQDNSRSAGAQAGPAPVDPSAPATPSVVVGQPASPMRASHHIMRVDW